MPYPASTPRAPTCVRAEALISSSLATRRAGNSQVNLETTRRNLVVAAYSVIGSMGRLDAAWLGTAAYVYDPNVHYKEVRRKWIGLSIKYGDGREETFEAAPQTTDQGWDPVK